MPTADPAPLGSGGSRLELKLPPPLLMLLVGFGMWALARGWPAWSLQHPLLPLIGLLLALLGAAAALTGVLAFRRAHTTVDPTRPERSSHLVSAGIYRFSRNPMYLGLALVLLGWALWLGNPLTAFGPIVFVLWMNRFQIGPEERALRRLFGEDYRRYCSRVRRWL
jgi:protein-S-isoprenylcysteine O-methyltransferase Ste14